MLSRFTFDAQAKAYQGLFERLLRRSTARSTPKNGLSKSATNGHGPSSNGGRVGQVFNLPGRFQTCPTSHSGATIVGNGSATRPWPGAREDNGARPRPVRVCFLIDRLGTAGTESQLLALIRGLDRSRVLPHLCLLDGLDAQSQALEPRDCPVIRLGVRSLQHPSTAAKALRLAQFLRAQDRRLADIFSGQHLFWRGGWPTCGYSPNSRDSARSGVLDDAGTSIPQPSSWDDCSI